MIKLRNFQDKDTKALLSILNDIDVVRYLSSKIPYPYTEQDAKWWIEQGSKQALIKAIVLNEECIGCIGITPGEYEYSRSGEIGYWLAKQYWGQGLMKLAIEQQCQAVFAETDIVKVFAVVFADNLASKRVLDKAGFEQEAILRKAIYKNGHFYDKHVFSLFCTEQN